MVSGSGTQADPYILSSFSDLELLGSSPYTLDKYYKLGADIDASPTQDANYNGGAGWQPRGDATTKFTGEFNGDGHNISGLYINRPNTDYVGLFGYVHTTLQISNFKLSNVNITGKNYVGAVVGYTDISLSLNTCTINGTITGTASYVGGVIGGTSVTNNNLVVTTVNVDITVTGVSNVGGIIGRHELYNTSSKISFCTIKGTITGTGDGIGGVCGKGLRNIEDISICGNELTINASATSNYVGGIIGQGTDPVILIRCRSTVNVTGRDYVGGLLGKTGVTSANLGTISYCSYHGSVTGRDYVGGLIGYIALYNSNSLISYCYSEGSVFGTGTQIGGLIGYTSTKVSNSYSISGVAGGTNVGGLIGIIDTGTLTNCYSKGVVSGSATLGGLVGVNGTPSSTQTSCVWDTETSGQSNSALGTGKTTAQMKDQSTYTNWDFNTPIWVIENNNHNNGYPYLFFLKYLDVSIAAAASLSASLTVATTAVTQELLGVISAQSTLSGDLKRIRSIAATVTCSSSIVGVISRIIEMGSSMGGVGSNSVSLSRITRIFSEITGGSFSSGILERLANINSSIHAVTNTTGELNRDINLDSEIRGDSTVIGELSKWILFLSEITGISSNIGMLQVIRGLQSRVGVNSSLTGNMIYITLLRGVSTGVINVTGRLSRNMLLAGSVIGTSYTSVILTYILNFKEMFCNITFKQSSIKSKIFYNFVKSKIKQSKIRFRFTD